MMEVAGGAISAPMSGFVFILAVKKPPTIPTAITRINKNKPKTMRFMIEPVFDFFFRLLVAVFPACSAIQTLLN